MMDFGATALLAGSTLGGALIQATSAQKINALNARYQDEANRISQDLANTAHQREVADLRAAGLNPILSAGGSGASTPQIGAVQAENPYNGLGNSAASVGRELGRLASQQYAQGVQSLQLNNSSAASSLRVQEEQDKLDAMLLKQQRNAIERWLDPQYTKKFDDMTFMLPDVELRSKRLKDIDKWLVDGYISDIKLRGNANWRSNWSSFMPFASAVGLGAANSAGSVIRARRMPIGFHP